MEDWRPISPSSRSAHERSELLASFHGEVELQAQEQHRSAIDMLHEQQRTLVEGESWCSGDAILVSGEQSRPVFASVGVKSADYFQSVLCELRCPVMCMFRSINLWQGHEHHRVCRCPFGACCFCVFVALWKALVASGPVMCLSAGVTYFCRGPCRNQKGSLLLVGWAT